MPQKQAGMDYRVNVVRGTLAVNGRPVERILDLGDHSITLLNHGNIAEVAASAFWLGLMAANPNAEYGEAGEVIFAGESAVCLPGEAAGED
jgi:hypothetical protein